MNTKRCPVISKDGTVLIPTYWSKANKLVKEKKAIFVKVGHKDKSLLTNKLNSENKIMENTKIRKDNGFIVYLKLKYNPENVDVEKNRKEQPFVLGFDSGTYFNGLTIVSKNDNVNYQYITRASQKIGRKEQSIKEKIDKRRVFRRERRCRSKLYRRLHIKERLKLSATVNAKVQEQFLWINRLCKYYPISNIRIEKFRYNMKHLSKVQQMMFTQLSQGLNKLKFNLLSKFPYLSIDFISGFQTYKLRTKLGLSKNESKAIFNFLSHCVDSYVLGYSKLQELKLTYHFEIWRPVRFIIPIVYFGKGRRCLRQITSNNVKLKSRGKVLKGGVLIGVNRYKEERKVWSKLEYSRNNHTSKEERKYYLQERQLKQRRRIDKLNGTKILTLKVKNKYKTNYINSHRNMLCTSSKQKDGKFVGFVRSYIFSK